MIKGNMSNLLKQAQDVQEKIEEIQNQLADMVVDAEAGGGMVSVKVNGRQEILQINIDPEAMKEDKEMLEDLIISAVNKALTKAQTHSQEKMHNITGGMISGLKIPGI